MEARCARLAVQCRPVTWLAGLTIAAANRVVGVSRRYVSCRHALSKMLTASQADDGMVHAGVYEDSAAGGFGRRARRSLSFSWPGHRVAPQSPANVHCAHTHTHLAQICTTQFTKTISNVASFRAPAPAHVAASRCFFDRWILVVGDSATCHLTNRRRCVSTAQRAGRQNCHLHQCDVLF